MRRGYSGEPSRFWDEPEHDSSTGAGWDWYPVRTPWGEAQVWGGFGMLTRVGVVRAMRFESVAVSLLVCAQGRSMLPSALAPDDRPHSLQRLVPVSGEFTAPRHKQRVTTGAGHVRFSTTEPVKVAGESEMLLIEAPLELARQVFGTDSPAHALLVE